LDKKIWMQRAGVTRGKMLFVAVLAVVLVTVIVVQLGGSAAGSVTPRRQAKEKDSRAAGRGVATSEQGAAQKDADRNPAPPRKPWPRIPLAEILDHDPLTIPPWLAPPSPAAAESAKSSDPEKDAQRQRLLAWDKLRGQGVGLVLITPDGPVATVGDRQVRVGDVIDGFRVEKIDGQGLVLADPKEGSRN
jgi:hypothetical protein